MANVREYEVGKTGGGQNQESLYARQRSRKFREIAQKYGVRLK